MMTDCRMIIFVAGICAIIEIRSMVMAMDDGVECSVLLLCGCIPYSSVHQECGACTANILHDGQVDVRAEACLCTHRQMNIICILMFFCSYVF
mgnify:CR=1 FL=1